jgi:hypothetical protein
MVVNEKVTVATEPDQIKGIVLSIFVNMVSDKNSSICHFAIRTNLGAIIFAQDTSIIYGCPAFPIAMFFSAEHL